MSTQNMFPWRNKKNINIFWLKKMPYQYLELAYLAYTVKPVLVVTSIKQPTCIKQPEEGCPKIHRHI